MSRSYEMAFEVAGVRKEKRKKIERALRKEWRIEILDWNGRYAFASGQGALCGGESEEDFAGRVSRAIWRANGACCDITVSATCLESLPCQTYSFGPWDYKGIRRRERA